MNYSTSGATWKIKYCLDNAMIEMGADPEAAHKFTILHTDNATIKRKKILIEIEPYEGS